MKKLTALFLLIGALKLQAQDPAIAGIDKLKNPIAVNEVTQFTADFLNGSSTAFNAATQVQWLINTPPAVEILGTYFFDDPAAANFVNITVTPYDAVDGQILYITSKPGVPFPGGAAWNITFDVKGKFIATNQPFSIQAESTPAVGTNNSGNDNVGNIITIIGTVLPVKLINFDVVVKNCHSEISWKSATEENFKNYVLEYSKDGLAYSAVSVVNGKGANSVYSATHQPSQGRAFYRLKQVDLDNKSEYSKVIALNINCDNISVLVYPNPAHGKLNINITGNISNDNIAVIYDAAGKKVSHTALQAGTNQIDISRFAAGLYNVQVINNTQTKSFKIAVQ